MRGGVAYQSKGREQDQRHTEDVNRNIDTVVMICTVLHRARLLATYFFFFLTRREI